MCGLVAAGEPAAALADFQARVRIKPALTAGQINRHRAAALLHDRRHQHGRPKHELLIQAVSLSHLQV